MASGSVHGIGYCAYIRCAGEVDTHGGGGMWAI